MQNVTVFTDMILDNTFYTDPKAGHTACH